MSKIEKKVVVAIVLAAAIRTIPDLVLTQLSRKELRQRQQNQLRGGGRVCFCACVGPSSSSDNRDANYELGEYGGISPDACGNYVKGENAGYGYCESCHA